SRSPRRETTATSCPRSPTSGWWTNSTPSCSSNPEPHTRAALPTVPAPPALEAPTIRPQPWGTGYDTRTVAPRGVGGLVGRPDDGSGAEGGLLRRPRRAGRPPRNSGPSVRHPGPGAGRGQPAQGRRGAEGRRNGSGPGRHLPPDRARAVRPGGFGDEGPPR